MISDVSIDDQFISIKEQALVSDTVCIFGHISTQEYDFTYGLFTYNLDSGSTNLNTISIEHTRFEMSLGGETFWGYEPPSPDPVIVVPHDPFLPFVYSLIAGENYVTLGLFWWRFTDWYRNPHYEPVYGYKGDYVNMTEIELMCQGWKIESNENGQCTINPIALTSIETVQRTYFEYEDYGNGIGGKVYTGDYLGKAIGANGALWIGAEVGEEPFGAHNGHSHLFSYVLDDTYNILTSRHKFVERHTDWEFTFDFLFDPYWTDDSSNYGNIQYNGVLPIGSKYFGSKSMQKLRLFYLQSGDREVNVLRDTKLNYWVFPDDIGVELDEWRKVALQDDDSNGAIYITEKDKYNLLGIRDGEIVTTISGIAPSYNMSLLRNFVYEPMDEITGGFNIGPPSRVLTESVGSDDFTDVLQTGHSASIEIDQIYPVEVYHKVSPTAVLSSFIYQNSSAADTGWANITPKYPVYDLRTCNITDPLQFVVTSGALGVNLNWCLFGTKNQLKGFPTNLTTNEETTELQSIVVASFSGSVTHVETTNYNGNPYLFVSLSGYSVDGDNDYYGKFYQRSPTASGFINVSEGLPETAITSIRVDDRI
jgi:hypothetical protein